MHRVWYSWLQTFFMIEIKCSLVNREARQAAAWHIKDLYAAVPWEWIIVIVNRTIILL